MTTIIAALWQRGRSLTTVAGVVGVFIFGFAFGSQSTSLRAQSNTEPPMEAVEVFEPFWQAYNLIQRSYLDRDGITAQTLMEGALDGMMDSLGDEFSGYMSTDVFPLLNEDLSGEVEGIGALVRSDPDTEEISIVSVLEGSPAESAGLQSGDVFVAVNGEDALGMSQFDLVIKVRGPKGTVVELTMRRGDELIDFSITRDRIVVPTVEFEVLQDSIGYIRLREFSANAAQHITEALDTMQASELDGLILDLRGNPGGLLDSAIDVASLFIEDGTILIEDFGDGEERVFESTGSYAWKTAPMVVLIDEGSASASELVAGAMQDQAVATILGVTSFGKGTVQNWQTLVNGGGLRLTIARWLTPNRHWIHGNGITPDVIVENPIPADDGEDLPTDAPDAQLEAALEFLLKQAVTPRQ